MMVHTQRERLASLEASQEAHVKEHDLTELVWTAKLDAIDARLRGIERFLLDAPPRGRDGEGGGRYLQRRDIVVISGSAGLTSLVWWLADLLRTIAGG